MCPHILSAIALRNKRAAVLAIAAPR